MKEVIDVLGPVRWAVCSLGLLGTALVAWGAILGDGYSASVLLEVGAALFLAVPLLLFERLMNSRMSDLRDATERSIDNVRTDVEGVRQGVQEARTRLDSLGDATADRIMADRLSDTDALETLRKEVSELNAWRPLHRAQQLGAVDQRGVRVRLPDASLRIRFQAVPGLGTDSEEGAIRMSVEERNGDRTTDVHEWEAAEPADTVLPRLAEDLYRAGKYPGDASFDATAIFKALADTLDTVLALRTGRRQGANLAPAIELIGDWAVTLRGLEHTNDKGRWVATPRLLSDPERARTMLASGDLGSERDAALLEAFATATDYHRGEDQRAARGRVPRAR